jgi:catechol 2,3-dioxygenase-like lactoylglutathione lyase family enzyme
MTQGVEVVGLYVRDQDEALAFYVEKLGFRVHTDVRNGDYRWLTVQHPEQPSFQLGLFAPGPPGQCAPSWLRARCPRWCWWWTTAERRTTGCGRGGWSSPRSRWTATAPWTRDSAIHRATGGR